MAENSQTEWSKEEEELLKLIRESHTIAAIHDEFKLRGLSRSRKAIERKAWNMGLFYKKGTPPVAVQPVIVNEYSEAWNKISQLKIEYKEDFEYRKVGLPDLSQGARKILCISDFHIPFDRDDLIKQVIEEHKDADILVVNGDMMDLHAVSTWPKERSVVLLKEYEIALEYVKLFSRTFPHTVLTRGNHEYRLNRYFHSNVSPSVSFLVNKEILGRLVQGETYDNEGRVIERHNFDNVHYDGGAEGWFAKIGKTMFLHPQSFSSVEGKTSINAQEYFMEREDIDSIVVAHTHQQSKIPSRNKLCIEQGCLCCPLDYEKQGKLKYKAMTLGYAIIYQDKYGNCDFNISRTVYLGTQYPLKREFDDALGTIPERTEQ